MPVFGVYLLGLEAVPHDGTGARSRLGVPA